MADLKALMLVTSLLATVGADPIARSVMLRSCQLAGIGQEECANEELPGVVACPSTQAQDCADDR